MHASQTVRHALRDGSGQAAPLEAEEIDVVHYVGAPFVGAAMGGDGNSPKRAIGSNRGMRNGIGVSAVAFLFDESLIGAAERRLREQLRPGAA
jgi:hypothetical protein